MTNRTQPISELLGTAAAQAAPVVRGITEADFAAPTPCSEYDVRALLNHLFQVVVNFQALAAKQPADFATTPDYVREPDWRDRFEAETVKLVAAWAAPGAEEGTSAGMGLPSRTVGSMALLDLTVHVWDLAQATGRSFRPESAVVENLAELVDRMAPTARKMNVFGEPVEPPEGASAFELLLAATGRDPRERAAQAD